MYSLKLGAAWVLDAALLAPVPLTEITIIVPNFSERDGLLNAIRDEFFRLHPTSGIHFEWKRDMNRLEVGKSIIYFFFASKPDQLRGRRFDYIWAANVGRYRELEREDVLRQLPHNLLASKAGPVEEVLLVTY